MHDPTDSAIQRLIDHGIHPVRGGAPDEGGATGGSAATMEGDPISREELERIRNDRRWRAKQHERDAELKRREARLDESEQEMSALRREVAALRADTAEGRTRRSAGGNDDDLGLPDLPSNAIDEPDGFRNGVDARDRALATQLRQVTAELNQLKDQVKQQRGAVGATASGIASYQQIRSENERLFKDYVRDNDLTPDEATRLRNHLQAVRVEGEGYGAYVEGAVSAEGRPIWGYTPEAISAADRLARFDTYETRIREDASKRAAEQDRGRRAERPFAFGESGVPAQDAPIEELRNYYFSLPQNSADAQRFADAMPLDQFKQILESQVEVEAQNEGYGPDSEGSPLGVQDHVVEAGLPS